MIQGSNANFFFFLAINNFISFIEIKNDQIAKNYPKLQENILPNFQNMLDFYKRFFFAEVETEIVCTRLSHKTKTKTKEIFH